MQPQNRRDFLRNTILAGVGLAVGAGCEKCEPQDKKDESVDRGPKPPDIEHQESKSIDELSTEIVQFFDAMRTNKVPESCTLYDEYKKNCGKEKPYPLKINHLRDAIDAIVEKSDLPDDKKEQFKENKFIFIRTLGLLNMAFEGKNTAGGKQQISGTDVLCKNYFNYKKKPIGSAIAGSAKLAEAVDPTVIYALIANETDYVNFYNRAEGVQGDFQFTSAKPPKENLFTIPEPKNDAEKKRQSGDIRLLRRKRHNEFFELLDDIEDKDIRKQLAFFLSYIFGNLDYIRHEYGNESKFLDEDERKKVLENADFLMAIAFYNADIARIDEDSKKGQDANKRIDKEDSASAFIETLPFYKGSGAGKLYVPRLLAHYALLHEFENIKAAQGSDATHKTIAKEVDQSRVYRLSLDMALQPNFGIAPKEEEEE